MTDLTKELNRSQGIPFLEYKHFVTRTFFPKVSLRLCQFPLGLLNPSLGPKNPEVTFIPCGRIWQVHHGPLSSAKHTRPAAGACAALPGQQARFLPAFLLCSLDV